MNPQQNATVQCSHRSSNTHLIWGWHLDKEAILINYDHYGQSWLVLIFQAASRRATWYRLIIMATSVAKRTADGVFIKEFKAVEESKKLFCRGNVLIALGPLGTKHYGKNVFYQTFPGRKRKIYTTTWTLRGNRTWDFLPVWCCMFVILGTRLEKVSCVNKTCCFSKCGQLVFAGLTVDLHVSISHKNKGCFLFSWTKMFKKL